MTLSDLSPGSLLLLCGAGLAAGFINTLAGGGSLLTIPALMLVGLPVDVANGTNRVAVWLQSWTATAAFHQKGRLPLNDIGAVVLPTLVGTGAGALVATVADATILEPVVFGLLVAMALTMALRPRLLTPAEAESPRAVTRRSGLALFGCGLYAGFIQAGVGYFMLAALAGMLRYDLVRANALKVLLTGVFTTLALVIFALAGDVAWGIGAVVAVAAAVGGWLGVKVAVRVDPRAIRWLLVTTITASVVALALR